MKGESVVTQTGSTPEETPIEVPPLAGDFPTVTFDEWKVLVAKVLNRGRPEDKQLSPDTSLDRLRRTTTDGLHLEPLYSIPEGQETVPATGVPGFMPFTRGRQPQRDTTSWDMRAFHDDPDADTSRREVLADLERGATSIWLGVGQDGIAPEDIATVLTDVDFALAGIHLQSNDDPDTAAKALVQAWSAETANDQVSGGLGIDPFGLVARRGGNIDTSPLVTWTRTTLDSYPNVIPVTIDVRPYHDAGAGTAEELAFAVATGVEYLRILDEAGIPPADVFDRIEFRLVATDVQFTSLAKLRALRRMWARIGEVLDVPENKRGARTHAVTSERMMARHDPYVNMLRGTIAAFSAAAGNADAVTVLPFDHVLGLPTSFSRRISRNTQVILNEESHLGRVADPGGGSFYVESLTEQIATKAWTLFTQIESSGGMRTALEGGRIHEIVADNLATRDARLADRSQPLTGVSEFPNLEEPIVERTPRAPLTRIEGDVAPFMPRRDAVVFERLRARAFATPNRPTALLLGLGTRRDFGGREGFTLPFLAAGGIKGDLVEVLSAEEIPVKVADHHSKVAVICSSPKVNGTWGAEAAKALREAGVEHIYLAGKAKELGEGAAAIDGSFAMGSNVVEITSAILDQLGVPALSDSDISPATPSSNATQGAGA
ncbi:methylmalonyl-CoA mutase small subunit [Dermatophilus congolensis]|uniref:Methylmalonyl-CoA mutase small subunit n=1 Tax=Dermatophilus congolensis TaxID=1863 RepID=A0A239VD70_9MICO|nr:methylmalonyl-CoA mutase family protein [Dermatophilus congolensis]MBO3128672.1 methylmalonyl-CoA mutase small subunit [Dermatophilus congolensis]MBO3132692.1 methylmalonyl-CoA mutase small subunit [Dermatophilus congolensis]MBO3133146.1 methylmalonyl-CoA mutase small subunit [Dermatophilus congolensis]MBO3135381.1 methylmalonyl-CoA mutase small subunit [Dermatophilus congolensis]MBO3137622.1 methylmalonyl-CoA mutase small subunit [Dermatophilus congolensis]